MLSFTELCYWLNENNPDRLDELWCKADTLRHETVGDEVHFRGLLEISNYCRCNCLYCGIRAEHRQITRYRMTADEIMTAAAMATQLGYGTLVMQAGEDLQLTGDFIAGIIREIKKQFNLAITLSLGERTENEWIQWKEAGADRYLLRFETSNQHLFDVIHPGIVGDRPRSRLEMLATLRKIGFEIGSGVMVGIPGQDITDLARDLFLFQELDLDMIGCGPYLPHPNTPLGTLDATDRSELQRRGFPLPNNQVTPSIEMGFKVIALTRLLCPDANIPSTTAIATLDGQKGRMNGLSRGANIIMPNLTPQKYRSLYEIYPNKAASYEDAFQTHRTAVMQVESIGRCIGTGFGSRKIKEI